MKHSNSIRKPLNHHLMIEQIENLHWKSGNKLVPLKHLSTSYLINIRNVVKINPKLYSGLDSDYWAEKIKYLLDFRRIEKLIKSQIKNKKSTPDRRG